MSAVNKAINARVDDGFVICVVALKPLLNFVFCSYNFKLVPIIGFEVFIINYHVSVFI